MPTATPISELVRLNLVTTLQTLVTAGVATEVVEPRGYAQLGDFNHGDLVLIPLGAKRKDQDAEQRTDRITKEALFEVLCLVRKSDKDNEPVDAAINDLTARVESELMKDPSRGGYAIDTAWTAEERLSENTRGVDGARVLFAVTIAHETTDPTSL